jgi:hypothetical protein
MILFRGLRALNVIHDDLEHGAELTYQEEMAVPEEVIRQWLRRKCELGVFSPIQDKSDTPNYMPDSVMKSLEAWLAAEDTPTDGEESEGHSP